MSILAHVVLGWEWSVLGGITYGAIISLRNVRQGAILTSILGALCVGGAWGLLVAFNVVVAKDATWKMLDTMGQIFGNLPGSLIVVLTILIGSILGVLGAILGFQTKAFTNS